MISSLRTRRIYSRLLNYFVLIVMGIIFFFPFYWMFATSFKNVDDTYHKPPVWFPVNPTIEPFQQVLEVMPFLIMLRNTFLAASLGAIGIVVSCSLVAYSIARINWPGRNILLMITISVMIIPFAIYMIPLYIVYRRLHLLGTLLPLWLPMWFGNAFYIFLLTQFMKSVPMELSYAARIDGCSEFMIYRRVMLPLIKSSIALVMVLHMVWSWKDLIGPLLYITKKQHFTLSLGLLHLLEGGNWIPAWNVLMAASTLVSLPLLILFVIAQRWFTEGIALTGMKG